MALTFDQKVNTALLVGILLGALFTLLGLLIVITQLRALLKDFPDDRQEQVRNANRTWASPPVRCVRFRRTLRSLCEDVVSKHCPSAQSYSRSISSMANITTLERPMQSKRKIPSAMSMHLCTLAWWTFRPRVSLCNLERAFEELSSWATCEKGLWGPRYIQPKRPVALEVSLDWNLDGENPANIRRAATLSLCMLYEIFVPSTKRSV